MLRLISELEGLRSIRFVDRKQPHGVSELQAYPQTQLPLAVVMGRLPAPTYKVSTRNGHTVDLVRSVLGVDIIVYALNNVDPDSTISELADDVWARMFEDETHGFKWVLGTEVVPETNVGVWDPYCAFSMLVNITYIHGKGGI